jgi:hypothetical protein
MTKKSRKEKNVKEVVKVGKIERTLKGGSYLHCSIRRPSW